jgi:RNA polymerase-interacting CarD/CdnL/TRCF family regulator
VHPVHGLCRIARVEQADGRNGSEACYVFNMGSARNPVKVLMRAAQAEAAGLRRPITSQEAEQVLRLLHTSGSPLAPRSKAQLDLAAAGVSGWHGRADGAFGHHQRSEQAMLSQALSRLIEELSYVLHVPRMDVEAKIRQRLGRARRAATAPIRAA